nr:hypothetical protein CFP56_32310 [Quercus suber]
MIGIVQQRDRSGPDSNSQITCSRVEAMLSRAGTAAPAHSLRQSALSSWRKPIKTGSPETMNQLHTFVSQVSGSPAKSRTSSDFSHQRIPSDGDALRSGRHGHRPESQSSQYSDRLPAPLLSQSRTPSPLAARQRSARQSEDEEDPNGFADNDAIQQRPLVPKKRQSATRTRLWQKGGLGRWLFQTPGGRDVYVLLLVFWLGGCQFGTLLINRFILWTGTYRLPYPLTMTLLQLVITHILLLGFANLTRVARTPLINLGFGGLVAPSEPLATGPQGFRRTPSPVGLWSRMASLCGISRGGITGSGVLDFNWRTFKQVLPLAIVFFAKVVLSNISYA